MSDLLLILRKYLCELRKEASGSKHISARPAEEQALFNLVALDPLTRNQLRGWRRGSRSSALCRGKGPAGARSGRERWGDGVL